MIPTNMRSVENDDESSTNSSPYNNCALFSKPLCGPYKDGRILREGIVGVDTLKDNVGEHLKSRFHFRQELVLHWTERLLIE